MAAAVGYSAVTGAAPNLRGEPVSPRPRTTVHPVKLRFREEGSALVVLRTVCYRAECSCGWRGQGRRTWHEAAAERRYHAGSHDD